MTKACGRVGRLAAGAFGVLLALVSTGCDELSSRRQIQRGNDLYNEGRYAKAVEEFEPALARTPDLAIGHHNAGLAYFKMFEPGSETPENLANAAKAADHFQAYLQANPDDSKIVGLLTTLWLDSNQYEKALAYWEKELAKDPSNRDILLKLANMNRQAGRFDAALAWHGKRAALETTKEGKINALLGVAQLQLSRLSKPDLVDEDRVAVADVGIAAVQAAEAIDPTAGGVYGIMGALYQYRSFAHGAHWARQVDAASWLNYVSKHNELAKAGAAKPTAAAGAAGTPAPTPAP